MSFSKQETENIINLLSNVNSTLQKKYQYHQDNYSLLFSTTDNREKTTCNFFVNLTHEQIKNLNEIVSQQKLLLIDEHSKGKKWNNIVFKILPPEEEEKDDEDINLTDMEGKETKLSYSKTKTELIFRFTNITNQETIDKLLSLFKALDSNRDKIMNNALIKFIVEYNQSSYQSVATEISNMIEKHDSIRQFRTIITVYLYEINEIPFVDLFDEERDENDNSFHICIVCKTIRFKTLFVYTPDSPSLMMHSIPFENKSEKHLIALKNIRRNLIQKAYNTSFRFDASFYADYIVKKESLVIQTLKSIKVTGHLRTKELNLLSDIRKCYPKDVDVKEMKTFSFTPTDQCSHCSKKIGVDDYQYYCYWCKVSFCLKCVESTIENNSGRQCYLHKEHNLLYFKSKNPEDLMDLDEYKLGKNLFASVEDSELGIENDGLCDECNHRFRENKINRRYLCVSCKPGLQTRNGFNDYCYACIANMRSKINNERYFNKGHNDERHVLLLLIHEVGDYYTY